MLALDYAYSHVNQDAVHVYGLPFGMASSLLFARDLLKGMVCPFRNNDV